MAAGTSILHAAVPLMDGWEFHLNSCPAIHVVRTDKAKPFVDAYSFATVGFPHPCTRHIENKSTRLFSSKVRCYLVHLIMTNMKIREKIIQTYIMFSHTFGILTQNYGWDIFIVVTVRNTRVVNSRPWVDITTRLIRNNSCVLWKSQMISIRALCSHTCSIRC